MFGSVKSTDMLLEQIFECRTHLFMSYYIIEAKSISGLYHMASWQLVFYEHI